jgi:hypothetical protein
MAEQDVQDVIDSAGTPKDDSVFAVFDAEQQALRAERALTDAGFHPQRLHPRSSTPALQGAAAQDSLWDRLTRLLKTIGGGEGHEAERYADHLRQGRFVLAVHVPDKGAALVACRLITGNDGYDVTYYRPLAIEYMSPEANARHGVATHAAGNTIE